LLSIPTTPMQSTVDFISINASIPMAKLQLTPRHGPTSIISQHSRLRPEGMTLAPGMTTENDSDLAAAARAGDRQAFAELYNRYRGMVHAILLAHARPGEPDDLVQDVFMRALQKIAGLRDTYAFGGWLA